MLIADKAPIPHYTRILPAPAPAPGHHSLLTLRFVSPSRLVVLTNATCPCRPRPQRSSSRSAGTSSSSRTCTAAGTRAAARGTRHVARGTSHGARGTWHMTSGRRALTTSWQTFIGRRDEHVDVARGMQPLFAGPGVGRAPTTYLHVHPASIFCQFAAPPDLRYTVSCYVFVSPLANLQPPAHPTPPQPHTNTPPPTSSTSPTRTSSHATCRVLPAGPQGGSGQA